MSDIVPVGQVRVVSLRINGIHSEPGEVCVRGDRLNPLLGNPFYLAAVHNDNDRRLVIEKYDALIENDMRKYGSRWQLIYTLALRVHDGEKLALQCWCAPKECHLDVVCRKIEEIVRGLRQDPELKVWIRHGRDFV